MPQRLEWDYQVLVAPATRPGVDELNHLGGQGWEVIAGIGVGELGAVEEIWYIFKRPR